LIGKLAVDKKLPLTHEALRRRGISIPSARRSSRVGYWCL